MVYRDLEGRIEPLNQEGRILAVDYGEKRIGLALSDPLRMFAKPYKVLENKGTDALIESLSLIIKEQNVLLVIMGVPYAIEGGNTPKTDETLAVQEIVSAKLSVPVKGWDERYSSSEANSELKKMGYTWQEARLLVDAMAAAMILKDYLANN